MLIIPVLITLILFALFLGGGLVAQGYLYQQPADRLPLRALAGAVLIGSFLTIWVMIDRGAPRKYDTFFEFSPYETKEFSEFEAIRWMSADGTKLKLNESGQPLEVVVKFKKQAGVKGGTFVDEVSGEPFQLNSSTSKANESYMTAAIRARPAPEAEPVRFNAVLKEDSRSSVKTYAGGPDGRRFVEEKGSRYIQADQLGVIYVSSSAAVFLALLLNFTHFLLWFLVFWAILQFTRGHALMLASVFGLVTMLMVMPLLFKSGRATRAPAEAPKAMMHRLPSEAIA